MGKAPASTRKCPVMESDFDACYEDLTGHAPFWWQKRLFRKWFSRGRVPRALDLPTGLGKTSVMAVWLLARLEGAPLPRRLVYVVDRRAVVDQATEEAERLRDAAQRWFGVTIPISTLRGQHADNRAWLADPTALSSAASWADMPATPTTAAWPDTAWPDCPTTHVRRSVWPKV